MKQKAIALTPRQAADWIEVMPPVEVKNCLLDLLIWQARNHKALVHVSWYLRKMQEPKPKFLNGEWMEMTKRIGKNV